MLLALLVGGRILASSWIKVLQKQLVNHGLGAVVIGAVMFVVLSLLALPMIWLVPMNHLSALFWISIVLAILLDTPGNILLIKAIGMTDLSLQGPLMAYKPIMALLLGVFLLGEVPSWYGLLGVFIIFLGSAFLAPSGEQFGWAAFKALFRDRGVQYGLISLVLTASAAITIKQALAVSSPLQTFLAWAWLNTALVLPVSWVMTRSHLPQTYRVLRHKKGAVVILALSFLAMQLLTIYILDIMYVAYALALFQLGALINVFFGHRLFMETNILQRAVGSGIMIIGAILLIMTR